MAKREISKENKKTALLEKALASKEKELLAMRSEVEVLNSRIENLIDQIQGQLTLASLIQRTIVPTEIPTIPGFEFSTKYKASLLTGGDYFDIFEMEDRFRFGILMSCSNGYGMSALFLSVVMRSMGQKEGRKGLEPHEFLNSVYDQIKDQVKPADKTSAFYGIIDRRNFELKFVAIGDLGTFHITKGGADSHPLKGSGNGLSKDFKKLQGSQTISLNPRDRLVFISEGIARAKNKSGDFFGEGQVQKIWSSEKKLSCHEMRNEILYQHQKFTGTKDLERDVTVIVADVKDRVLKLAKS